MKSLPCVIALVALALSARIDGQTSTDVDDEPTPDIEGKLLFETDGEAVRDIPPAEEVQSAFAALNAEMSLMPGCAFDGQCAGRTHLRVRPNGTVFWAAIDGMTEMDTSDANFTKVAGLANTSCVSWESVLYRGHFLRHRGPNAELVVNRGSFWDFNFSADATFCPSGYSFESYNGPGWFLNKSGASLVLSQSHWSNYASTVIFEEGRATIGMWSDSLGMTQTAGSPDKIWESRVRAPESRRRSSSRGSAARNWGSI